MVMRWNTWNELLSGQDRREQLLTEAVGRTLMQDAAGQLLALDIRRSDDAYVIEAAVPGFGPEDVEITFDEGLLTVRGSLPNDARTERAGYVQRELQRSDFHRHVHLPAQVIAEGITATFDRGMLTIVVPREQRAQPRRIAVTTRHTEEPKVITAPAAQPAAV